jgi:hypothetical protein
MSYYYSESIDEKAYRRDCIKEQLFLGAMIVVSVSSIILAMMFG